MPPARFRPIADTAIACDRPVRTIRNWAAAGRIARVEYRGKVLVDLVAASPRLAPHFHLPLQHGSDDVLRRMRRPYTAAAYQQLVERIRPAEPIVEFKTVDDAHRRPEMDMFRPEITVAIDNASCFQP